MSNINNFKTAKKWLNNADVIIITASNGLSISEGFNIFIDDDNFKEYFSEFREKYGVRSILEGFYSPEFSIEDREKFSKILEKYFISDYNGHEIFHNLISIVGNKDYFIVTSNTDTHFQINGFSESRIYEIEGNIITGIGFNHAAQLSQKERFSYFLDSNIDRKIVFLELGIGSKNKLIKEPIMQLVETNKNYKYITFNVEKEIYIPEYILEQSIGILGPINITLKELLNEQ